MNSELAKTGVPSAHRNTRQRVAGLIDIPRLFQAIDADPAIVGAGVVYIESDFSMVTLREFQPICSIAPKKIVLREAPRHIALAEFMRELQTQPRESRLVMEAVSTAFTCAGAVIGWMVVASGTAAIPFTAGASSVVAAVGFAAAAASSVQCLVGVARTSFEVIAAQNNDWLDSLDWYRHAMVALDAVSLAGVGVSALTTVRLLRATKAATGKSTQEVLKGLNRPERARLTRELLSIQHPGLTSKMIKLRQLSGEFPKRFTSTQIRQATITQIADTIGASASFASSALSGNVKAIAVGLYEEIEP
ncbi:hypothetical protein SAMN05216598_3866 [Pseudomonas asplenii]|uniref:NAD synthetase n=1 Tax=Pseudomonas asplenii TaxID=53407 RepID=A0A1H1XDU6_9PSED|nr:NAD synthetase [Pseudomonas asplenii]SDT07465.1 hypothetical protein SAMN05216598_3866 [Pseudomonas asplenii]